MDNQHIYQKENQKNFSNFNPNQKRVFGKEIMNVFLNNKKYDKMLETQNNVKK